MSQTKISEQDTIGLTQEPHAIALEMKHTNTDSAKREPYSSLNDINI